MTREPTITVEGVALTNAQAMSVRVAVAGMLLDLADADYCARLGSIADGYRARLCEVERLLVGECPALADSPALKP